jgi:hypothetical protein
MLAESTASMLWLRSCGARQSYNHRSLLLLTVTVTVRQLPTQMMYRERPQGRPATKPLLLLLPLLKNALDSF